MRPPSSIASPPLPPPPSVCWGENRAKFSDVVAGNQDNLSPFSNHSNNKSHKTNSHVVPGSFGVDGAECAKRQSIHDLTSHKYKYKVKPTAASNDKDGVFTNSDILGMQSNSHINSYFVNTFNEPPVSFSNINSDRNNLYCWESIALWYYFLLAIITRFGKICLFSKILFSFCLYLFIVHPNV